MIRVGLTGGIASGKSYVRARLQAAGFPTVDLDTVAHAVMAPGGPAYDDVVAAFGQGIVSKTGEIDRRVLGPIVFAEPAARRRLEELVHPRVREEEARRTAAFAAAGAAAVVTDGALLIETGQHLRFDRLIVVHCPLAEQVRRIVARDGLDEPAARARVLAQMPTDEKRACAHFPIDTSGSFADTDAAVDAVAADLRTLRLHPPARPALSPARAVVGTEAGPRGLHPRRLLVEAAAAGFLDLARLTALLQPPAGEGEPWYRAAQVRVNPPPWLLSSVTALTAWPRGADAETVAAAACSLARLTHHHATSIAGACFVAVRVFHALAGLAGDPDAASRLAARWVGVAPHPAAFEAADAAVAALAAPPVRAPDDALDASLRALGYV